MFIKIPVDRFIGIVLLVCSTTTYIFLPYLIKEPSMNSNQKYGASFFPKVLLILTIALSIVLIIKTFFNKSKENTNESIKKNKKTWVAWAVFGISIVYSFVIETFGFVLTSITLMSLILVLFGTKKWYYYAILIVMIFLINYVFQDLMNVMLP